MDIQTKDTTSKVGKSNYIAPFGGQGRTIDSIRGLGMPKLDYQAMWKKLWADMEHLTQQNIAIFHPAIVLGYMDYIEQIEEAKKEEQGNGS